MGTVEEILEMLEKPDREVRCAAALVLGRLRPVTPAVVEALLAACRDSESAEKSYFLDSLAATHDPSIIPELLCILDESGSLCAQAVEIMSGMGQDALQSIEHHHQGESAWKSGAYLKVVASVHTDDAVRMLLQRLESLPWKQARACSLFLLANFDSYPSSAQDLILNRVRQCVESEGDQVAENALVTCLKLSARLSIPIDVHHLMRWIGTGNSISVRHHAIRSLAVQELTEEHQRKILPQLLGEVRSPGSKGLVESVLDLLSRKDIFPLEDDDLQLLADSPHTQAVEFGLREMAERHGLDGLDQFTQRLDSTHRGVRMRTLKAIQRLPDPIPFALGAFREISREDARMEIIELIRQSHSGVDPQTEQSLLDTYVEGILAGEELDLPLLTLIATLNRELLNDVVLSKACSLQKEGRTQNVVDIIQPVVRWRHAKPRTRYALARAHLELAGSELSMTNRDFERCINILSPLTRIRGFNLPDAMASSMENAHANWVPVLDALMNRGAAARNVVRQILMAVDTTTLPQQTQTDWHILQERAGTPQED